jgi:hypothetical protein
MGNDRDPQLDAPSGSPGRGVAAPRVDASATPKKTGRAVAIRFLFAATIVLFGVQWIFITRLEEPYPAITFPGFAGSSERDGVMTVNRTVFSFVGPSGQIREFSTAAVFFEYPRSHDDAVASLFLPPGPLPGSTQRVIASPLGALLPGYRWAARRRANAEVVAELNEWLKSRGEALIGEPVVECSVRQQRETWSLQAADDVAVEVRASYAIR